MVKRKPAGKEQTARLPKPVVEERVRTTDHTDPHNRDVERARSREELNPILHYYTDDGTINVEETLNSLAALTDFLANLEATDMPFEREALSPGLYLIHSTMLAAILELEAQFTAAREAKRQEVRHG